MLSVMQPRKLEPICDRSSVPEGGGEEGGGGHKKKRPGAKAATPLFPFMSFGDGGELCMDIFHFSKIYHKIC